MTSRTLRTALAAFVLSAAALGATSASAKGFGGGFGGGFHGGHHGFHGGGFHGGWGHHGGWGYRRGWGPRFVGYYGGCTVRRYVNVYGDLVARRVCY